MIYDIAIVGNGIVGTLAAYELKKKNSLLKICLIGPDSRNYSATMAEGAMNAVYGEVEENFDDSIHAKTDFKIALNARKGWIKLLEKIRKKNLVYCNDTIFYAKKNGTSFERKNFEKAVEVAKKNKCLSNLTNAEIQNIFCGSILPDQFDAFKLKGEFCINPINLFKVLDNENKQIKKVNSFCKKINFNNNKFYITLSNNEIICSNKLLMAAGSESSRLLSDVAKVIPIVKGIGTALIIKLQKNHVLKNYVVRTTNRGGAQCGIHIVPYLNGQFYIGAGNYVADIEFDKLLKDELSFRTETVRWLIETTEKEILGKKSIYFSKFKILQGFRPKSIDGLPLIGNTKVNKNIFVASGTNRVGFTFAPAIVNEISNWFFEKDKNDLFKYYVPDRKVQSWGSINKAKKYFSESRYSNLLEHNIIKISNEKQKISKLKQLENLAFKMNSRVKKKFKIKNKNFTIDPDCYSVILKHE